MSDRIEMQSAERQDPRMPNKFLSLNRWPNIFVLNVIDHPDTIRRMLLTEQDVLKLYHRLQAELTAAGLIPSEVI